MSGANTGSTGSSPLARGLRGRRAWRKLTRWIIPARAGFTPVELLAILNVPDHPRSRGVYMTTTDHRRRLAGSSPLARGLPPSPRSRTWRRGIIPARAGFTADFVELEAASGDHPRSRGVYLRTVASITPRAGSSPLARGLLTPKRTRARYGRIIPARAGFTQAI